MIYFLVNFFFSKIEIHEMLIQDVLYTTNVEIAKIDSKEHLYSDGA